MSRTTARIASLRRRLARALGSRRPPPRRLLAPALAVAALGLACRLLYVHDAAPGLHTREQPGIRMAARYSDAARGLLAGDGVLYPRSWPDRSETGLLSRPPGYAGLVAVVFALAGDSYLNVLVAQAVAGALLPVLLLQLTTAVAGHRAGLFAGLAGALSPPLAYHAAEMTPDSLSALLAVAILVLLWGGRRRQGGFLAAGAVAGLATWLRPNFLLLPAALLAALPLAFPRPGRTLRRSLALLAVSLGLVLPITVRNYRLYGELVPVSINMGIVLWEGIADAGGHQFGARSADLEVAAEEAQRHGDPRYARWWASPDGIARDRERLRRSLGVVRQRPRWFAAAALARVPRILDASGAAPPLSDGRPPAAVPGPVTAPRWLQALSALRAAVRPLQRLFGAEALARVAGLLLLLLLSPRRWLFLLLLPLYVVAMQAPLHFEPRFALPLHALGPAFEGVGWAGALGVLGALGRAAAGAAARRVRYWM